MSRVTIDIERALPLELSVSLDDKAGFLRTAGAVGKGVLCVLLHRDVDLLTVLNVDGRSVGVGQGQSVERHVHLVVTRHVELSVGGTAGERVGHLARGIADAVALLDGDMGSADGGVHILGNVSGDIDLGRRAIVGDSHRVVGDGRVVNVYTANLRGGEGLTHDGHRGAAAVDHITSLRGGNLIDDIAHADVHRLCTSRQASRHGQC